MISRKAYGKINLSLDVLRRREDNYHDLRMIMQEIDLSDSIYVEEIESDKIIIDSNDQNLPKDKDNIVYRVVERIKTEFEIKKGIKIFIEKNIPVSAGLAGGSTDAGTIIKILNELWDLKLEKSRMVELTKDIGADIPFFIYGGTALSEGIGDIITPISSFSNRKILLVNPGIEVSTAYVYNNLELDTYLDRPETERLIRYINIGDTKSLAKNMKNVLESVTIKKYTIIDDIKADLMKFGALGSMMSGSGPTVFGIFDNYETIKNAFDNLSKKYEMVIMAKTM
ncbi:MAG: 4-(cytidine 5'-diphospho)-2-C-methyl-D-erythritol kinase [Andreesenia angusta]|nr:4-(cytidine 5'-diphospho)-2-C-methyl-D-erythritol kinase [Andreesenia angusta]